MKSRLGWIDRSGHIYSLFRSNQTKLFGLLFIVTVCAGSILLRLDVPLNALANAHHDDALFTQLASFILNDQWLGPYNALTLAKGPIFPLFLALTSSIGLPLKLTEHIMYLFAAGFSAVVLWRLTRSSILTFSLFASLSFSPVLWCACAQRVTREGLYANLSLLVFSLLAWLLFCQSSKNPTNRLVVAGIFGVIGAVFWLTREEEIWLIPTILVMLSGKIVQAKYLPEDNEHTSLLGVKMTIVELVGATVVSFGVAYAVIMLMNFNAYGTLATNDFKDGNFPTAYGAIQRIKTNDWQRYIHYSPETEAVLYANSPTAQKLKPFLDSKNSEWRDYGCDNIDWSSCPPGIAGGWFVWALRQAATEAGIASAGQAQEFFGQIADELNAACDLGTIECFAERKGLAPPYRSEYLKPLIAETIKSIHELLLLGSGTAQWTEPSGQPWEIRQFASVAGPLPQAGEDIGASLRISGWAGSLETLDFSVVDEEGEITRSIVSSEYSPELTSQLVKKFNVTNDTKAVFYNLRTSCLSPACKLVPNSVSEPDKYIGFSQLSSPAPRLVGSSIIEVSSVLNESDVFEFVDKANINDDLAFINFLSELFAKVFRWLALVVPFGILVAMFTLFERKNSVALATIYAAAFTAVIARVGMIAIISTTSWPATNAGYLMPAIAFAILTIILGVYFTILGMSRLSSWLKNSVIEPKFY
jgi:hypothetical protein